MDYCCDLQVDVNGEAVFMVDKKLLSSYSGRLSQLFGKSVSCDSNFKVLFHDFPGGAKTFELITRFCYNHGSVEISPTNISFLHSAAHFMVMSKSVSGTDNLIEQTEKSLEEIRYWTWSELLLVLKKNQDLPAHVDTSSVVQKCLETLVGRLALPAETSPYPSTSSPESFGFRISCDSRSTESLKTCSSRTNWWFDDLLALNHNLIEKTVKCMLAQKFDHGTISKFLFHYQKSKFILAPSDEKSRIIEMVVEKLCALDHWSVSYKNLMGILRISQNFNIGKCTRCRLEDMIGLRMHEATLDNLLIPSTLGVNYLYDVNLVLRLFKSFNKGALAKVLNDRVIRVAHLLDQYLAEVAPDPCLRPSKFIALATALPDYSRDSFDELYHAMDMYLEVHTDLSDDETFKICSALNYEKLSPEACVHLSENHKFPSRSTVQALLSQQTKLKSLLLNANYPISCSSSPCTEGGTKNRKGMSEQIVLSTEKFSVMTENEKIRTHIQGMQCRVTELEKVCQKMQSQVANMRRSNSSSNVKPRSLPKLCS